MIPGLTIVRKPLETYLVVREIDGDRDLTALECEQVCAAVNSYGALLSAQSEMILAFDDLRAQRDALLAASKAVVDAIAKAEEPAL